MRSSMFKAAIVTAALAVGAGAGVATGHDDPVGHESGGGGGGHAGKNLAKKALFAALDGRNELDPVTLKKGAGDPDGRGSATVLIDGTTVCWGITVTNISQPIAAHIHRGKRHQNGPVVVPLFPPLPTSGDPGASSGCTENVDAALARDIQRHPRRYYVNVHTADFPGGAVRGQLFRGHR
jgi:hypothetical protein